MAEIFQLFIDGVVDGGATKIDQLYRNQDDDRFTEPVQKRIRDKVDASLEFLKSEIGTALLGTFAKPYQLLMLVAAYAYHKYGIPTTAVNILVPPRARLANSEKILDNLAKIEGALQMETPPPRYKDFAYASSSSTQRIASRKVRFVEFVKALSA